MSESKTLERYLPGSQGCAIYGWPLFRSTNIANQSHLKGEVKKKTLEGSAASSNFLGWCHWTRLCKRQKELKMCVPERLRPVTAFERGTEGSKDTATAAFCHPDAPSLPDVTTALPTKD